MKMLMLSTAIALTSGAAAFAQDAASPFRSEADPMLIAASDFLGKRIYALEIEPTVTEAEGVQSDWEDIGEVNDVIIGRDGAVDSVLVDIGGFLGLGERRIAVDMQAIRFVSDSSTADLPHDYFLVMNANRALLETAPEYSWSKAMDDAAGAVTDTTNRILPDDTAGDTATTETPDAMAPATTDMTTTDMAQADATPMAREGYASIAMDALTADDVQGASVYDAEDKRIGEVSELVLSADGKLTEAVIDVGGFLGIGAKPVALPIGSVDVVRADGGDETRIYVSMTKEELEALPKYEG
ncbi:MAG: PRC-barrel domain-containing protein [Gemmobacter sp.]|nr:PRC-barrel domain-containing protein [Gemmobacter sp.]